mgnify:CR=1 FL=1
MSINVMSGCLEENHTESLSFSPVGFISAAAFYLQITTCVIELSLYSGGREQVQELLAWKMFKWRDSDFVLTLLLIGLILENLCVIEVIWGLNVIWKWVKCP